MKDIHAQALVRKRWTGTTTEQRREATEPAREARKGYLASRESDKAAAREKVKEGKGEADGR